MVCNTRYSTSETRHHLVLFRFFVVDELLLDELLLLVDFFFLSSSSSSSFLVLVELDGACLGLGFGFGSLLRVSVRVLVDLRFISVFFGVSRVVLLGVSFTLRSCSRRLDEVERVVLVRLGVSTRFDGSLTSRDVSVLLRELEELLYCSRR